jgi:two-component system sensor histidine kinase DegS
MFDLRPPALDRAGLGAAVRELLERMQAETEIDFVLDDHLASDPSDAVRVEVYRITQEAIANVRKHSRASTVEISVAIEDSTVHGAVSDDGVGFDPAARRDGSGLVNMTDRLGAMGGRLSITSEPGRGTSVTGIVPLHRL